MQEIQEWLFAHQDQQYANFTRKLIPTVSPEKVIGVRIPILRTYAKQLLAEGNQIESFLSNLPHQYFEENQLHALLLSLSKDLKTLLPRLECFLPHIDNWATCDILSPKIFKNYDLLPQIKNWLSTTHTYTIRFGIGMLMQHYLGDNFKIQYPRMVCKIRSHEYYVNIMIAWYLATALAKHYEQILPFIKKNNLDKWTHNKTIQKALESYRITREQKDYLRTLRR